MSAADRLAVHAVFEKSLCFGGEKINKKVSAMAMGF